MHCVALCFIPFQTKRNKHIRQMSANILTICGGAGIRGFFPDECEWNGSHNLYDLFRSHHLAFSCSTESESAGFSLLLEQMNTSSPAKSFFFLNHNILIKAYHGNLKMLNIEHN